MNFRPMRRSERQLTNEETEEILAKGNTGILAVLGDGGYPYAVPLNYVYEQGKLYFHCAKSGHKLDALRTMPKVSFCVVTKDQVLPDKLSTDYRSAIIFGEAGVLSSEHVRLHALRLLNQKYAAEFPIEGERAIEKQQKHVEVVEIVIEHMSGKRGWEL